MKTHFFKRGMAGLLSLVMCLSAFIGLGTTTAFAAGEQAEVYLISFPRSGDANLDYSGTWGHSNLHYMNGWYSGESKYTTIRAMHSYDGNICYCIEPGTPQDTGDRYTSKDETFWDNLPSDFNSTISPYDMKLFIGRIMQYGYTGPISTSWRSQNASDAATLAQAMATQVLIWETVVGERDEDFNHISPGSYDAVKSVVSTAHPLYSQFISYYNSIEASVQRHSAIPSFMAKTPGKAQNVELAWNGTNYTATLTDSNNVLSNYSFSANEDGISFSVSGNKLVITAATAPSDSVRITASKSGATRRGIITWTDGRYAPGSGIQDVISYAQEVNDPVQAFLNLKVSYGSAKIIKTYKFSDINYAVASREDKEAMFLEYSELLNSLDSGATTKITINNRRLNRANFEKTILLPLKGDALDEYREEYNRMLLDKATGANSIIQEKYITISVCKKNVEEARNYFARVGADLIAHFGRLGSKCVELEPDERLRIFHDFYRAGEETEFRFDIKETRRKGHDFKDFICPDSMEFTGDYFKIGERYGRVLFLREYASYIKDSMVAEMTDLNRNLMMSIDVIPVPTDEAVREAESRLLGVETNATNWQRRQNANNNFSAQLPYDIEQQRKEMKEFLDDLTTRDQRMMFAVLTMVHTADTKEQLDNDTEALLTTARKHLCQFGVLKFQQLDGLNTAMPFGVRKIESFRTLTTESLAVFIPFRVQDICHTNGVYYGQNVISKNMIIADRRQLLNGNEFILGVSGGGKSFTAKGEIINQVLAGNADIIIIDPEREYSPLVRALGGEIINISATSPTHINAMDMNREYGDGANPVILKSEFIMSLCEQLIGGNNLGAVQKSIIDRCTASVYRTYQQNNYTGEVPTLQDFRAELLKQSEPEAQEIALAIELFTNGSLNTFAKKTNVDTDNRLICYDILDLGKQLMPIGMLVVLDSILNRITQNRAKGKNTFIFIDEIYLLFQHEYSANFLFTLWKRVRKYGAYATGITQNVDDLLQSHTARTMLANSEFIVMLNQASTDRLELAKLLNISDTQLSYITNVDAGHGLIKVGSSLVPLAGRTSS